MIIKKDKKLEMRLRVMAHFIKQLKNRYGAIIDQKNYWAMCKDFRDGKLDNNFVRHGDIGRDIYQVVICRALVKVVFDHNDGLLHTALPKTKTLMGV